MHAAIQLAATMPPAPVSPYRLEKQAKGPPRRRYDKGVDTRDLEEEAEDRQRRDAQVTAHRPSLAPLSLLSLSLSLSLSLTIFLF